MTMISARVFVVAFLVAVMGAPALAASIPVPNGDFNDNSDGDLADVDIWVDGDAGGVNAANSVIQVDNALGKTAGDLVMRGGFKFSFHNPTVSTGATFDSSNAKYTVTLESRAFNNATLTVSSGDSVPANKWGFVFRDMTNGKNIKTFGGNSSNPGFAVNDTWQTFSFDLTQADMLAYELAESVDIDTAEIGIRIFKQPNAPDHIAFDNVTLESVPIPEPASLALMGIGLLATMCGWRHQRQIKEA